MPDFERVFDSLAREISAKDPEWRAWVEGHIAGKRRARIEVAVTAAVAVAVFAALRLVI